MTTQHNPRKAVRNSDVNRSPRAAQGEGGGRGTFDGAGDPVGDLALRHGGRPLRWVLKFLRDLEELVVERMNAWADRIEKWKRGE